MKHKTLVIALGLSLLFNVFVLIGFTWTGPEDPTARP